MKIAQKISMLFGAILLATAATASMAADADTTAQQMKIAVVNVQQVLQQSPRVAKASKKLEDEFKSRQNTIGDEQKSLQDELDKFKKESTTMSQKDRDSTQKKISDERAGLVKKVVAYQQDLQKEQNKVMQNILNDLNGIVASIAKKQNYSLVFDSQAVIFALDGTDITKDVSKQFNG